MNVIVGIVVNAISELSAKVKQEHFDKQLNEASDLKVEINKLKEQMKIVEALLEKID